MSETTKVKKFIRMKGKSRGWALEMGKNVFPRRFLVLQGPLMLSFITQNKKKKLLINFVNNNILILYINFF